MPDSGRGGVAQTELGTRRVEFWTAIVMLIVAITTSTVTIIESFGPIQRAALRKPIEGVWDFSMTYTKFHGDTGSWSSNGKALILWKHDDQQYEIYFGYMVTASGEKDPILTGFSKGYINADAGGWPPANNSTFSVDEIRYIARMHREGKEPTRLQFEYTDCSYTRKEDRADTIECTFKTPQTEASVRLKWGSPLH